MSARVEFTPTGKLVTHNMGGYTNHGCRCAECRASWADYCKRRRAKRASLEPLAHGSSSTYTNWACRCRDCTAAHTKSRMASA